VDIPGGKVLPQATLKQVNLMDDPKMMGIKNGLITGLKHGLFQKFPEGEAQ
jgi:hypothetical protein